MEVKSIDMQPCRICGRSFVPRFSFQKVVGEDEIRYYCSQRCVINERKSEGRTCSTCGKWFKPQYAYQRAVLKGREYYYCSDTCADGFRDQLRPEAEAGRPGAPTRTRRIAILNQKGGTGKTTTAINLAAGFAMRGFRVLLIDMDAQGNVGISLGLSGQLGTYHLLIERKSVKACSVPIRNNLDIITSSESLAAAEIKIANMKAREMILKDALVEREGEREYDYVILDCPPSLYLINQNALIYADEVIVPVSCDFLAMVGVKQVLRTIKRINDIMGSPLEIGGILPTMYDVRTRLSKEVLKKLRDHFGKLTLPPIRVSTRLKEAPSHKQTIFEYAPQSHGAEDYLAVVARLTAEN